MEPSETHIAQADHTAPRMFEMLDATGGDVVAIRGVVGTRDGFRALYEILAEKTEEQGSVQFYEEAPGWTLGTYLSQLHGIVPDLRYGATFNIERYAPAGDSVWTKIRYNTEINNQNSIHRR